jgi:tricarballylate dehydrogenase
VPEASVPEDPLSLVVVGCGAGGLSTALSHLESASGATVAVLERSTRSQRGGNTTWTGSFFRLQADGSPADDFATRMHDLSRGCSDASLIETLAAEARPTIDWLKGHGLAFESRPTYFATVTGPRLMPVGGGAALVDSLARRVESLGGAIHYETRAHALRRASDGIWEVSVESPAGPPVLRARRVVLACGGFEGNPEMLVEHLGPFADWLPSITEGGRMNQGEGIAMGIAAGAGTAGQFDGFHGEPVDPRSRIGEALVMAYPYGILINGDGQRFLDEGADTPDNTFEEVAVRIWREQQQTCHLVGDQKLLDLPGLARAMLTDRGPLTAQTLAELARIMDVDPQTLEETVQTFNSATRPGDFDPERLDNLATHGLDPPKSNWARPIQDPPFCAWPIACAITFTYGGLRTDSSARVLTESGEAIGGLYAVGETAGLYYFSYPGATSVLRALTYGRIAGRHSARTGDEEGAPTT